MVLYPLRRADQGDIADGRFRNILDRVRRFGRQSIDHLAGFCRVVAFIALQQRLDFDDMAFRFLKVIAERRGKLRIA